MNKKASAKKVGKTIAEETFNQVISKVPILSDIKAYIDDEILLKITDNIGEKTTENCNDIQMIVEYLQTQNQSLLYTLNNKYSGFGYVDGKRTVPRCNIENIDYKTIAKATKKKLSRKSSSLSKISENDDEIVFSNPIGSKRKRKSKSKKNTRKKTRRNTRKNTKRKTRRNTRKKR